MQERKSLIRRILERTMLKKKKPDILPSEMPALITEKQKQLNLELWRAAGSCDNNRMMQLIKDGADIAAKDKNGWTPLHHAALHNRIGTYAILIREYSNAKGSVKQLIAEKDGNGMTALHLAAQFGYTKACDFMVRQYIRAGGYDIAELIDAEGYNSMSVLRNAEHNEQFETAHFLENVVKRMGWLANTTENRFMPAFSECIAA